VSVGGATASYYADTPPGALIVVLAIGVFALSWPISALLTRRRRVTPVLPELVDDDERSPLHDVAEEHAHLHRQGCGHIAVQHGDHTDFIHEGHRHALHADHYDEH
jgi:zinc transport system permease protein